MDESLKVDVIYWAAFYERRMRVGNKKIFHLEAWVVKVMSLYKVLCTSLLIQTNAPMGLVDATYLSGVWLIICIPFLCSITSLAWTWTI